MKTSNPAPLYVSLSIVLLLAVGFCIGLVQQHSVDLQTTTRLLDAAQSAQAFAIQQKQQRMAQLSSVLANNTDFTKYVAQALSSAPTNGGVVDASSILDLLEERRGELGLDSVAILDSNRQVIAATGDGIANRRDLSKDPIVARLGDSEQVSGILEDRQRVLWITLTPLRRVGETEASLMVAMRLDAAFAAEIARASNADTIAVISAGSEPRLVATSVAGQDASHLLDAIANQRDVVFAAKDNRGAPPIALQAQSEHWFARSAVLPQSGGKYFVLWMLSTKAVADIRQSILVPLAIGFGVLLVALICGAFLIRRNFLLPLATLTDLSQRAMRGDYDLEYRGRAGSSIGKLGEVFNYLLNDLRRFRPSPGGPRRRATDRK